MMAVIFAVAGFVIGYLLTNNIQTTVIFAEIGGMLGGAYGFNVGIKVWKKEQCKSDAS